MSDVLEVIVETHHLTGEKTAISYLRLAATLGFLEIEGGAVFLTLAGQRYLDGEELAEMTANALVSRVSACQEILEALSARPQSIAGLSTILKAQGHEWSTRTQLRYRLRWMEETGLIVRGAGGRPLYSVPAASGVSSR